MAEARYPVLPKATQLIAEDEEVLRDAIAYDFKKMGFRVLEAESGNRAFELLLTEKIDLVISDLRMPDGGGLELLDRVRARPCPTTPVLLLTGCTEETEKTYLARGAAGIIPKPFDRDELVRAVLKCLGKTPVPA